MSQDKEEYEVGIPLDDLSSGAERSDSDSDGAAEDLAANSAGEEAVGLPSLFDEDELAEVGLRAAPFDDGEAFLTDNDEVAAEPDEIASEEEDSSSLASPEAIESDASIASNLEDLDAFGSTPGDGEITPAHLFAQGLPEEEIPDVSDDLPTPQPTTDALRQEIGLIHAQLNELKDEFSGKLKYDAHKDKIIDKLHQELQEYKEDIVKKHILSIVLDVVKVADDIRKWLAYFRSLDVSQRDPVKLFRYLEAIPSDLEDIFYWQGVKPFTSHEGAFNPARQRTIKKIPTNDLSKDKTIAKSLRPGYEWEDKIIRQEMVAVYVYEDDTESADTRDIDE